MTDPIKALCAALDAAPAPVRFFLRDDDGGWDDERLFALLDTTERAGVPIDVAMIPCATDAVLAAKLCARIKASPQLVGVHQHGFAHADHETVDRKCEFGAARSPAEQRHDLVVGWDRLRGGFGTWLDPIFTPPWNRCSTGTPALLAELGYAALSRDRGAGAQAALPELAVDLDWSKQLRLAAQHGEDGALPRIARELGRCMTERGAFSPIGVMLHHADMSPDQLATLGVLLHAVNAHPKAQWLPMRVLASAA